MLDKHFILHLTLIPTIGPAIIKKIQVLQRSGVETPDLYLFSSVDWMQSCGFNERIAQTLTAGLSNKKVLEDELQLIAHHNVQWVTVDDAAYPSLLREIYLPPALLYFQGNIGDGANLISIVGSRKANFYGQRVVNTIVPEMVAAGWVIVSGGALGIDTIAHEATLNSGGKTIAVLGSGLLNTYPVSNRKLFKAIVDQGGCVVSSFPLLAEALPGNFPARNRIIAGLSHGCLVVQAAQKSGALITAHYALEQGREIFAVPGLIDDALSAGCHTLIQNGAKLVTSSADILSEYGDRVMRHDVQTTLHDAQKLLQKEVKLQQEVHQYTENQKKIMDACSRPASLDDIVHSTDLDMMLVQSELFDLQLAGKIEQSFTGMWVALRF
jgi:DNA processing protein